MSFTLLRRSAGRERELAGLDPSDPRRRVAGLRVRIVELTELAVTSHTSVRSELDELNVSYPRAVGELAFEAPNVATILGIVQRERSQRGGLYGHDLGRLIVARHKQQPVVEEDFLIRLDLNYLAEYHPADMRLSPALRVPSGEAAVEIAKIATMKEVIAEQNIAQGLLSAAGDRSSQ